jgi:hypothetical protein
MAPNGVCGIEAALEIFQGARDVNLRHSVADSHFAGYVVKSHAVEHPESEGLEAPRRELTEGALHDGQSLTPFSYPFGRWRQFLLPLHCHVCEALSYGPLTSSVDGQICGCSP